MRASASVLRTMSENGRMGMPNDTPLGVAVIGASGDLARKKIFPALFALFCQDLLPERFGIVGFGRTALTGAAFRTRLAEHLTCRYSNGASCSERMDAFLARCDYVKGEYGAKASFLDLYAAVKSFEGSDAANRVFYMAIPSMLFLDVAHAIAGAGLVTCGPGNGWSRVVLEKPFGRDRPSSDALTASIGQVFTEDQIYRIDHYLGKAVIQNLLVLRFANLVFEPIWNHTYINSVRICWKEDAGVGDRGGYFDQYGIIRDVVQNHLLQIVALTAMERPTDLTPTHIRNEKVRVLSHISPIATDELALGQYCRGTLDGIARAGYREEPHVAPDSVTPTYAAAVLHVNNARWATTPFFIEAGKGLDTRRTEVRIRFRPVSANLFCDLSGCPSPNELRVRIQPDEGISLRITNRVPGLEIALAETDLDLQYHTAFKTQIPDAYECLLLDVLKGDKSLFIRDDELAASWDVFTPALHALERRPVRPEPYPIGGKGPPAAHRMAIGCGAGW